MSLIYTLPSKTNLFIQFSNSCYNTKSSNKNMSKKTYPLYKNKTSNLVVKKENEVQNELPSSPSLLFSFFFHFLAIFRAFFLFSRSTRRSRNLNLLQRNIELISSNSHPKFLLFSLSIDLGRDSIV